MSSQLIHSFHILAGLQSTEKYSSFEDVLESRIAPFRQLSTFAEVDSTYEKYVGIAAHFLNELKKRICHGMIDVPSELGAKDLKAIIIVMQISVLWTLHPKLGEIGKVLSTRFSTYEYYSETINPESVYEVCALILEYVALPSCFGFSHQFVPDIIATIWTLEVDSSIHEDLKSRFSRLYTDHITVLPTKAVLMSLMTLMPYILGVDRLKIKCGKNLTESLLRSDGISSLLEVLIEQCGSDVSFDMLTRQVSKIVLSKPSSLLKDEYYCNILNQLSVIVNQIENKSVESISLAVILSHQIFAKYRALTIHVLIGPILQPSLNFFLTNQSVSSGERDINGRVVLTNDVQLETSIRLIELLISSPIPEYSMLQFFSSAMCAIYFIYQTSVLYKTILHHRLLSILQTYLTSIQHADKMVIFKNIILDMSFEPLFASCVLSSSRELMLVKDGSGCMYELDIDCFISILKICEKSTAGKLLLELLGIYFEQQRAEADISYNETKMLMILRVILKIMEEFGSESVQDLSQMIFFTKKLFITYSEIEESELIHLSLNLLLSLLNQDELKFSKENVEDLQDIKIHLNSALFGDEYLRQVVKDIKIKISTITMTESSGAVKSNDESSAVFREAIKELSDELIPIRAFGINKIKSLILTNDPVIRDKTEFLTHLFLDHLEDQDSFIYLNSVKALSALTDVYPTQTLEPIASRYVDASRTLDYRLKIGEVLLKTIQRSGTTFSKHGETILAPIFKLLLSDSPELKSSAISLLSCVFEIDPFSLLPVIHQLGDYVHHLLVFEQTPEIRRAALFLIGSLIAGFTFKLLDIVAGPDLKQIYRDLKYIESTDEDQLCRGHAAAAVADLDKIVKSKLFGV